MGEGQVIQGITGGILAIVGILLAIISSGIWFQRVKIRIGFLGIGLALSGVGLFVLITSFPQYAIGFSVIATLALAFAAFLTIKEADAREQRHRNSELSKERRDRDAALLNDIIEWAIDIATYEVPAETTAMVGITSVAADRRVAFAHMTTLANGFRAMLGKGLYTSKIAPAFGEELQSVVDKLAKDLETHFDLIITCQEAIDNNMLTELKSATQELAAHWKQLSKSTDDVITEAFINKMNILNI